MKAHFDIKDIHEQVGAGFNMKYTDTQTQAEFYTTLERWSDYYLDHTDSKEIVITRRSNLAKILFKGALYSNFDFLQNNIFY